MKNLKSVLSVFTLAALLFLTACNKDAPLEIKEVNKTNISSEDRFPWLPVISGLVYIVVELSEGQYSKTTAPDGTVTEKCSGVGNCGTHGTVQGTGNPLSTGETPGYASDYFSNAILAKTHAGEVILGMDETADPATREKFFYSNEVYLSPAYTIDNPEVLEQLGENEPIVLEERHYEVKDVEGLLYIVLK